MHTSHRKSCKNISKIFNNNSLLIGAFLIFVCLYPRQIDSGCNKQFLSTVEFSSGNFEAPSRLSSKPFTVLRNEQGNLSIRINDTRSDFKPMHCVYKFIAKDDERVVLNFSTFRLRGSEPECSHEYVDILVKLKPGDNIESSLNNESPNGRFCTSIMPRKIVSLHNMIVLIVYTDLEPPSGRRPMFSGTFEFVKVKLMNQIGPAESNSLCTHTVYGINRRDGEFQSITYPGVYVKGLRCKYKFIGEPNQRIRLEFLDLDLYSGGSHCPFDSIKVYDGPEESDQIINTLCGSHRSVIIFSTKAAMLVTFTTLDREAEIQNRGFSAYFEFGDKFVDPNFIQGSNAKHIRGSECDQRIISYRATKGSIVSPRSSHHPNAICRYIFEGLQTSLDYEKVLLKFVEFDLKTVRAIDYNQTNGTTTSTFTAAFTATTTPPTNSNNMLLINQTMNSSQDFSSSNAPNSSSDQCPDNYVRLYTGEQKPDQRQDPNDYDYIFCGNETPQSIESDAASLLMEYNSGSIGGYFRAEYAFTLDFRIPGLQVSTGCDFVYRSEYLKTGTFNSPRHPSWYINDMNCSYTFMTKPDETLLLQFGTFKMSNSFNEKVLGYNEACKGEDSVEILELALDSTEQKVIDQSELGTYCGTTTPGPLLSFRPIRINFRTNREQVHYGFSAIYNFYPISALKTNEFVTNCGGQIYANQRFKSGVINSPVTYRSETYEKRNHICSWNITARPSHKIALDFNRFELEGSPVVRGCITASVRVFTGRSRMPVEICGTMNPNNGSAYRIISENEWLSVIFISTKQASGSNGFAATWTEIKRL